MALKTYEKTIDGFKFYVQKFPAKRGNRILYRVAKAVGPSLLQMASVEGSADISALGGVIQGLFTNMNESEFETLYTDLLLDVNVQCPKSEFPEFEEKILGLVQGVNCFDQVFSGRYLMLFTLLRFVFEVNFGDFTGALAKILRGQGAA